MSTLGSYHLLNFTCIHRPLDATVDAMREVLARGRLTAMAISRAPFESSRVYAGEPPCGGLGPARAAFYQPKASPEITVLFTNAQDGWLSLGVHLSSALACRAVRWRVGSSALDFPVYGFEVHESGTSTRCVLLLRDGPRWQFSERGTPLGHEIRSRYLGSVKRERLDRTYLVGLAQGMGYPIADEEFWTSHGDAVYFEREDPLVATPSVTIHV